MTRLSEHQGESDISHRNISMKDSRRCFEPAPVAQPWWKKKSFFPDAEEHDFLKPVFKVETAEFHDNMFKSMYKVCLYYNGKHQSIYRTYSDFNRLDRRLRLLAEWWPALERRAAPLPGAFPAAVGLLAPSPVAGLVGALVDGGWVEDDDRTAHRRAKELGHYLQSYTALFEPGEFGDPHNCVASVLKDFVTGDGDKDEDAERAAINEPARKGAGAGRRGSKLAAAAAAAAQEKGAGCWEAGAGGGGGGGGESPAPFGAATTESWGVGRAYGAPGGVQGWGEVPADRARGGEQPDRGSRHRHSSVGSVSTANSDTESLLYVDDEEMLTFEDVVGKGGALRKRDASSSVVLCSTNPILDAIQALLSIGCSVEQQTACSPGLPRKKAGFLSFGQKPARKVDNLNISTPSQEISLSSAW